MLRLELTNISKRFATVTANDGIGLKVAPGEIHAVLGENGAGKSTLMKIIYGVLRPDEGEIRWNGEVVRFSTPNDARAQGIAMVFQHFALFDTLTVAENVALGLASSASLADVSDRVREVAGEYGLEIDPLRPVHALSVGERQRVEIVRALLTAPKLLILDEPTSVLDPQAVAKLFVTLRKLAAEGCSILYISHKLDEVRALCHRCTVLRGGKVTGEVDPTLESNASLSRLMIGAEAPEIERHASRPGAAVLVVQSLTMACVDPYGVSLCAVDLTLHAGWVTGLAGVSGNGQAELVAILSGEDARGRAGVISLFGRDLAGTSPGVRRALGLHFVPEERLGRASVPGLSLADNTLLTRSEGVAPLGWLRLSALARLARQLITRFRVVASGPHAAAKSLSGGNLQKFIVGREIDAEPKVLIVCQPTWGVDVGAAAQIRNELLALAERGCAVLVVSDELEELFEISDELVVVASGRLSPAVPRASVTTSTIGEWMSGLFAREAPARGESARA